jgi:hypothetical protein
LRRDPRGLTLVTSRPLAFSLLPFHLEPAAFFSNLLVRAVDAEERTKSVGGLENLGDQFRVRVVSIGELADSRLNLREQPIRSLFFLSIHLHPPSAAWFGPGNFC